MTVLIIITLIFILLFFIIRKISNKKIRNVMQILLVVFALEIYVFNFNSFRLVFKDFEEKTFTPDQMKTTNIKYNEDDGTYELEGTQASIEIDNVNTEIGTINLNIDLLNKSKLAYNLAYTDETRANYEETNYNRLPTKVLVNDVDRSKYITCYLSGDSQKFKINFFQDQDGTNTIIKINDITINKEIKLFDNISILRVFILSLISILIYLMITAKLFNMPYENEKQSIILMLIVGVLIIITVWISASTHTQNSYMYKNFSNALSQGKISLEEKPSDELMNLPNPYDITMRGEGNVSYIWDASLYNGKYYIYFGILPFLILPVTSKIIFGEMITQKLGVLLFSIITIIAISKLIVLLYKRWFRNIKFNYLLLAIIGTISGSLIFWINRRPDVYEFVLSSAMCFSSLGLCFFFKAIEKEVNYKYLLLSAICLALSVACRPNHLLISLLIAPKLIQILIQNIKNKKNALKLICVIGIPYVVVGISLMIYNYVRFDSILEFGTKYQLTVNDFIRLKNRIMSIPAGLITQLLTIPNMQQTFPFFYLKGDTAIPYYGYYYVGLAGGLFIFNPINFILLLLPGLKKKIKEKEAYNFIVVTIIVAFIICVADILLAGTLQRYSMDYAWLLNIASYLTLFIIISNIKSDEIKKYLLKAVIIVTMFMLVVNFIVGGLVSENNFLETLNSEVFYTIRYLICFWE